MKSVNFRSERPQGCSAPPPNSARGLEQGRDLGKVTGQTGTGAEGPAFGSLQFSVSPQPTHRPMGGGAQPGMWWVVFICTRHLMIREAFTESNVFDVLGDKT